ncbi:MAG: NAD(P) transhydrogenase subunit alpha [Frankia sp.]
MKIAIARETAPGERRVALIPPELPPLTTAGHDLVVEAGAGLAAGFPDAAYAERGATVGTRAETMAADVVLFVRAPGSFPGDTDVLLAGLRPGQTIVGLTDPLGAPRVAAALAERGVTSFALELLPRITRAQAMDVLSSQAALAGYKAALVAAERLNKILPMLTTAAGTLPPARALVIGAGVAGLQAIATVRRLGAVVCAYDVRPTAREQVESVGGAFVDLGLETAATEGSGGYAAAMDDDFYRRQRAALGAVVAAQDIVITTAQVPGRRAPILVTADMVHGMAAGSVIVDIAAAQGGNCELSRPDEITDVGGVTILAPTNLPATVPAHASRLYAKNISNFLRHVIADGAVRVDRDDAIIVDTLVTHDGKITSDRVRALLGEPDTAVSRPDTAVGAPDTAVGAPDGADGAVNGPGARLGDDDPSRPGGTHAVSGVAGG